MNEGYHFVFRYKRIRLIGLFELKMTFYCYWGKSLRSIRRLESMTGTSPIYRKLVELSGKRLDKTKRENELPTSGRRCHRSRTRRCSIRRRRGTGPRRTCTSVDASGEERGKKSGTRARCTRNRTR